MSDVSNRELSWKTHPSGYICENGSRLNEGLGPNSAMPPIDRLYEARLNIKSGLHARSTVLSSRGGPVRSNYMNENIYSSGYNCENEFLVCNLSKFSGPNILFK